MSEFWAGLFKPYNIFIGCIAILEVHFCIKTVVKLNDTLSKLSEMQERMKTKVTEKTVKTGQGQNLIITRTTQNMDYHRDLDVLQDKYEDAQKVHMIFAQVIPVFPLLGLLGTVFGLYSSLVTTNNMNEHVALALSSTLVGLSCSIFFKGINIVFTAGPISKIENGLERYKEEYAINNENREIEYTSSTVETEIVKSADGNYLEAVSDMKGDRVGVTRTGSTGQQTSNGKQRKISGTEKRR